jgi:hypothetical protein
MPSADDISSEFKNVIDWLNKNLESDPAKTSSLIASYIKVITYAFDKPYQAVDDLVHQTEFTSLNAEEIKILKFYFGLLQKRMKK